MGVPLRQMIRIGMYLLRQRLSGREKFPLIVELEPLFACNLACGGCGKIQHPREVMRRRLSVDEAVAAVEECGAPMVSVAGGEPLLHPQIDVMVRELLRRKRFVYLCTNGLLLRSKLHLFRPSSSFAFVVHIDGLRERHDDSVRRDGVFAECIHAIREAQDAGFCVTTNTTCFTQDTAEGVRDVLDFLNDEVGVDQMMISPGYAYEKAPDQAHFLGVERTRELFRGVFAGGRRRRWRLNHSPLFLDFLEGRVEFECSAWAIPSFSVLGWQRPCYLMADGYASSYRELIEETRWERYGRGRDPRCENCMAHCGYEPSAVFATTGSLRQSIRALLAGH